MGGVGGIAGWRWLLLCEGLPACALGMYTLYALPDRPDDALWLTDEQRDALNGRLSDEKHPGAAYDLWAALRDPRVLILAFSYLCMIVAVLGITIWLPQMLRERDLSTTEIGLTSAFPYFLACVGMVIWSHHMDRTGAFLSSFVVASTVAAAGFVLSSAGHSLPFMLAGISIAMIGMNACRPALFSMLSGFLQGSAAAAGIALVNSIANLGGFFGPYMMGWLRDATGSFAAGLLGLAGMLTLAAVSASLIWVVQRKGPRPGRG